MAPKTLLILNRKSAARPEVRAAVKAQPQKIEVVIPWDRKALKKAVRRAVSKGVHRIIAGGGDGTLNKVASAILATGETQVEMGVIPLGTANDFVRSWQDDGSDIARSLDMALTARARLIDVARINGKIFVNVASGGFGAMITATTDKELKRRVGGLAYSLTGLARLSEFTATTAEISIDGDAPKSVEMLALVVANNRFAGGGYDVAPKASLTDGYLDMGLMTSGGLFPDADRVAKLLDPQDETRGLIDRVQFSNAVIKTDVPFHLNLDGEPMVDTRFDIRVEPAALSFAVPENNQSA